MRINCLVAEVMMDLSGVPENTYPVYMRDTTPTAVGTKTMICGTSGAFGFKAGIKKAR